MQGTQSARDRKSSQRKGWIEWARALGALGVVLLHVCTSTFLVPEVEVERALPYAVLGIVFGRWAVPSFFMITGYLLLDPKRRLGWAHVRRYVGRMVLVLATFGLLFSLMEEAWTSLSAGEGLGFMVLVRAGKDVLTASSWDHLWYVYALVFVYLLVPVVRAVRERVGERGFEIFSAALFAVVLVVPTLMRMVQVWNGGEAVVPQDGPVALLANIAAGATYLCVGGCLSSLRLGPATVAAGAGSLAVMLAVYVFHWLSTGNDAGFIFLQGSCFACLYALLVLLVLRRVVGDGAVREGSLVDVLAQDSFGIYVLHPLFVHIILLTCDVMAFPAGLFELGLYVVAVEGSVVLTHLVRKVPLLGNLL